MILRRQMKRTDLPRNLPAAKGRLWQPQEATNWLAAVVSSSTDAIIGETCHGVVTSFNPAAERLFGYRAEEIIGKPIRILIPADRQEEEDRILARIAAGECVEVYETIRLHKNGSPVDVSVSVSAVRDAGGRIIGAAKIARDITERRRAEEELERMRIMLAEGQRIAHMGSFEYIAATRETVWSDEEKRIYGLNPAGPSPAYVDMLRHHIHPEDAAELDWDFREAFQSAAVFENENRIVRPDGSIRWIYNRAHPYFDSSGQLVKYIGATLDITERKRAEAERQKFVSLADHSAEFIGMCDLDFKPLYVNEAGRRLVGLDSLEEACAARVQNYFFPEDQPMITNEFFPRVLRNGSGELEVRFRHFKTGGALWMIYSVFAVKDEGGRIVGYATVSRDITERKRAEEALRSQAALLELAYDAIIVRDPEDRVTFWSRGAEETYGWTREEALGRVTHELLRTRFPKPLTELMAEVTSKGQWDGELIHKRKDAQEIVVASRWALRRDGAGRPAGVLEINRDVSERKHAEEQVQLLLREINHRAKNLLGVVQAIASQTAASEPRDFIARFSDRIQALAANQDLLVKSQWQGVELGDLVRAQLAHFKGLIGSRIEIAGPPLHIAAEAAQPIAMALHELATNAGKYGALSNTSGKVSIAWDDARDGDFHLSWTESAGPVVASPSRRGFGTTVIVQVPETQLDAEVVLEFPPSGVTWQLACPAKILEPDGARVNSHVPA